MSAEVVQMLDTVLLEPIARRCGLELPAASRLLWAIARSGHAKTMAAWILEREQEFEDRRERKLEAAAAANRARR